MTNFFGVNTKYIGSTLLVVGTAVGAGMLALPMISAATGLIWALILLFVIWLLMTKTALLILEVNLTFPEHTNNFSSMAAATLGMWGKIVAWLSCLLLLYSLTAAYIDGSASLLTNAFSLININIPSWANAILFVVIFGGAVFWSTTATDHVNRWLISCKGVLLGISLTLLLPHINWLNFIAMQQHVGNKYAMAAAPIFLCAFGFHNIIPTVRNYIGHKPKELRNIIISGSIVTLIIYIIWLFVTLGTVPLQGENSYFSLAQHNGSVGEFIKILCVIANSDWVATCVNGFANIAMTTSFLGVALSLFDFLADGFKRPNTRGGRLQTALITFTPPLVFALFYPKGFITALGYAAIFVAIFAVMLPVLMVIKLRYKKLQYVFSNITRAKLSLIIVFCVGLAVIVFQISSVFGLLPAL